MHTVVCDGEVVTKELRLMAKESFIYEINVHNMKVRR